MVGRSHHTVDDPEDRGSPDSSSPHIPFSPSFHKTFTKKRLACCNPPLTECQYSRRAGQHFLPADVEHRLLARYKKENLACKSARSFFPRASPSRSSSFPAWSAHNMKSAIWFPISKKPQKRRIRSW